MATYTVTYKSSCSGGGEHILLTVRRDGVAVRDMQVMKSQLLTTDLDWQDVLPFFLRETIKRSGATTLAQARTAIEAAEWSF